MCKERGRERKTVIETEREREIERERERGTDAQNCSYTFALGI